MNAMPPSNPQLFGDLARRLSEDSGKALLTQYQESFETARLSARRRLHEPLAAEDHDANAALATGAELCVEVLTAVWSSLHR